MFFAYSDYPVIIKSYPDAERTISENSKFGYSTISIRSPKDIISCEDEETFREIKEKISKDIYGMR